MLSHFKTVCSLKETAISELDSKFLLSLATYFCDFIDTYEDIHFQNTA